MKIYTKRGDEGDTSLLFGEKVSKSDIRCEAYGMLDIVNTHLGMCRAITDNQFISSTLLDIQNDIFHISTEVSVSNKDYFKISKTNWVTEFVDEKSVVKLENLIDKVDKQVKLKPKFIFPGSNVQSAAIDLARAQTRSAERTLAKLNDYEKLINTNIIKYINRLSDLLFYLARIPENEKERKYFEPKKHNEVE